MRTAQLSRFTFVVATSTLVFALAGSASATTLQTANTLTGNQAFSGVGLEFTVGATPITITAIGIYDSGNNGIIAAGTTLTADVMLAGSPFTVLASGTFTSAGIYTATGGYLFQNLTVPVTLTAGTYDLMGYGWTGTDLEHNTAVSGSGDTFDGGGLVTLVRSAYTTPNAPPGTPPNNFPAGDIFSAANIQFAAAVGATPLPGALPLFVSGLGALGLFGWRRKRKNAAIAGA